MRHRFTGLIGVTFVLLTMFPATAGADEPDDPFRFEGAGYGHGIGMSGYGARAMADAGYTGEEIVGYYYTGTSLSDLPDLPAFVKDDIWVNLLEDRNRFDFEADAGTLGLCHGNSPCPDEAIGTAAVGETWSFRVTGSNTCQFYRGDTPMGTEGNCYARIILGDDTENRIEMLDIPNGGGINRTYAYGNIMVRPPTSSSFHVISSLSLEKYVRGIGEIPLSWNSEALKAQAYASRTYGARRVAAEGPESGFSSSRKADCWCHLYDDTRSQVFRGYLRESWFENGTLWGPRWAAAQEATAGMFITHPDTDYTIEGLINSFFSSSSGGRSEENGNYWGGTTYPYLVSVDDPWSSVSPNNPWKTNGKVGVLKSSSYVASKISGLTRVDRITVTERHNSNSAKTVLFEGYNGESYASVELTGRQVRSLFKLKSHWIQRVCRERGPYDDDGCSIFEHNIVNIAAAGFVGALPGDNYGPDSPMTRSAMASFLVGGLELAPSSTDYFPDDSADPNHDAINALAAAGIVIGYPDGTYRPDNTVTRAEMAVYLTRALGVDLPESVPDPFPDVSGSSWYGPAVAEILSRGITIGHTDGTYQPDQKTTRGQMAAFLDRGFLGGF